MIMDSYRKHSPGASNLSREEKKALKSLKEKEKDLVIKCSDKSKSLVVMKSDTYHEKAKQILSDRENYEESDMTPEDLEKRVADKLKQITNLKKGLPEEIYSGLFPKDTRFPEFYGLPKTHKEGTPLRPVVAAFAGALSAISILVERILNQLLDFVPAHLKDTNEARQTIHNAFPDLQTPENTIIVTMDVVALYPSIPIADGIAAVLRKLSLHQEDIDMLGLSIGDIEELLTLILENNFFTFNKKVYRQKHGIAMGNHLAPPLAIIFMDSLEEKMLSTAEKKPQFYKRYVDDCLLAWLHGEEALRKFIEHCNAQHVCINFTSVQTKKNNGYTVPFMDMSITIKDCKLDYELYRKPTDSGVNLNFNSAVPLTTKMSVATQQFRRAALLSSSDDKKLGSFDKIEALLRGNAYSAAAITQAKRRSGMPTRQPQTLSAEASIQGEHTPEMPTRQSQSGTLSRVNLKLPYRDEKLHNRISAEMRKLDLTSKIRLVYTQGANLKRQLVRSAFVPQTCRVRRRYLEQQQSTQRRRGKPRDDCISCQAGLKDSKCEAKGVVYSLQCKLCGELYIGETKRTARARISEHHAQARTRQPHTAWGDHMRTSHPDVQINKAPIFHQGIILAQPDGDTTRKAREAIEIRDRKPAINKSGGWQIT